MPHTPQPMVISGVVVLLLVIGVRVLPQIGNFLAPPVTKVEQSPPCLDEDRTERPRKEENEKGIARRSSAYEEDLRPSMARTSANPLPRRNSPTNDGSSASYVAPADRLRKDEQDPTLEEEVGWPSWEEQYAQDQYLQEVEAMEEGLQREFNPTAVPQNLTVEQVAEIEAEMQEQMLHAETLPQLLKDSPPDEYGNEGMVPAR